MTFAVASRCSSTPTPDDARHGQDRRPLTRFSFSLPRAAAPAALAVAWALAAGCASSAPSPAATATATATANGAMGSGGGDRGRPAYTAPIQQITLRGGRLGWGGFEIGMSFGEVQSAAGRRLPSLGLEPRDPLCGFTMVEVTPHRQPLGLEFDPGDGDTGRVKAIWLLLPDRKGAATTAGMVRALKARFPDLAYLHSSHDPTLAESTNPRPFYRGANGAVFFVDPRLGIYFGDVCFE